MNEEWRDELVTKGAVVDALKGLEFCHYMEFGEYIGEDTKEVRLIRAEKVQDALQNLPPAQPEDIARDIATIIENEKDMRVVLKNAEPHWIPVTKEEIFKAGYEGREIRFRVDGRLFAIRELAQ